MYKHERMNIIFRQTNSIEERVNILLRINQKWNEWCCTQFEKILLRFGMSNAPNTVFSSSSSCSSIAEKGFLSYLTSSTIAVLSQQWTNKDYQAIVESIYVS
eukprot:90745_1